MTDELERRLRDALLAPPADFAERVVAAIYAAPEAPPANGRRRLRELSEWVAAAAALLIGLPQLALFLFGIWTVSAAG